MAGTHQVLKSISWILIVSFRNPLVWAQQCDYQQTDPTCAYERPIDMCSTSAQELLKDDVTKQMINPEIAGIRSAIGQQCDYQFLFSLQERRTFVDGCFFHYCAGTLISPSLLLTAAHCINGKVRQGQFSGELVEELFATQAPFCRHHRGLGRYNVMNYWIHEDYDDFSLHNDIAIVQFNTSIEGPLVKYDLESIKDDVENSNLTIVGWGAVNFEESRMPQYSTLPIRDADNLQIVDKETCVEKLRSVQERSYIFDEVLCAEGYAADACGGDSGGPLLYRQGNEIYLVGVVSWGPRSSQCYSNQEVQIPGLYTNISYYKSWINRIVEEVEGTQPTPAAPPSDTFSFVVEYSNTDMLVPPPISTGFSVSGSASAVFPAGRSGSGSQVTQGHQGFDPTLESSSQLPPTDQASAQYIITLTTRLTKKDQAPQVQPKSAQDSVDSDPLPQASASYIDESCNNTIRGCTCASLWEFNGQYFRSCANPNDDVNGNWCVIDDSTCDVSKFEDWQKLATEGHWDFCAKQCRGESKGARCNQGCLCAPRWQDLKSTPHNISYCDWPLSEEVINISKAATGWQPWCKIINPDECQHIPADGFEFVLCGQDCQ